MKLSIAIVLVLALSANAQYQNIRKLSNQPQYQQYQQYQQQITTQPQQIPIQNSLQSTLMQIAPQTASPCFGRQPGERLADSNNKRQYIVCLEEGKWSIMPCAPNTVFNVATLRCENSLKTPLGCASNPCLNNGVCTDLPLFQFRCDCQPGFAGDFCEKNDGCETSTCGINGVCIPLAAGAPLSKYCICEEGNSYGIECNQMTEVNPCLNNDADLKTFPTKANSAIYVQCDGRIPHLRFCPHPLVYNHNLQQCDWTASTTVVQTQPIQVPTQPMQVPRDSQQQQYGSYSAVPQQVKPTQTRITSSQQTYSTGY